MIFKFFTDLVVNNNNHHTSHMTSKQEKKKARRPAPYGGNRKPGTQKEPAVMGLMKTIRTTDKHVYFSGGFLSQFHMAKIEVDGKEYCCREQLMHAHKARFFPQPGAAAPGPRSEEWKRHRATNDGILAKIMASKEPKQIKRLGRQVKGFDSEAWNKEALVIVLEANRATFDQHPDLKALLLRCAYGDPTQEFKTPRIFVEARPDKIWGIGMSAVTSIEKLEAEMTKPPGARLGKNQLGEILTQVANEFYSASRERRKFVVVEDSQ